MEKINKNIIFCGDVNVAHTEMDIARPKENAKCIGFLPIERAKIDTFIKKLVQKNKDLILKFQLDITQPNAKDMKLKERAIAINFALAYDASLRWIRELLVL